MTDLRSGATRRAGDSTSGRGTTRRREELSESGERRAATRLARPLCDTGEDSGPIDWTAPAPGDPAYEAAAALRAALRAGEPEELATAILQQTHGLHTMRDGRLRAMTRVPVVLRDTFRAMLVALGDTDLQLMAQLLSGRGGVPGTEFATLVRQVFEELIDQHEHPSTNARARRAFAGVR